MALIYSDNLSTDTLYFIYYLLLLFIYLYSGRGGQSAQRFGRIREEKRHNFLRKVAETAVKVFIANDKINITGLFLAGSAQFKVELSQTDLLDPVSAL